VIRVVRDRKNPEELRVGVDCSNCRGCCVPFIVLAGRPRFALVKAAAIKVAEELLAAGWAYNAVPGADVCDVICGSCVHVLEIGQGSK
jgi:hypothetical protein